MVLKTKKKKLVTTSAKVSPTSTDNEQWSIKERPPTIDDVVVGNPDMLVELKRAAPKAQAMMLVGETGTGKTTLARACGMLINGNTNDIIYTDATQRGVDMVRELQAKLRFAPSGKKWVVIMDEVHNLTKDAFTGMLTLSENPPHKKVVFIWCTDQDISLPKASANRFRIFKIEKPNEEQAMPLMTGLLTKYGINATSKEVKKIALKALHDSDFGLRYAMQLLESMFDKVQSGIPVARVLDSTIVAGEKDADANSIEYVAGSLLLAAASGKDKSAEAIAFIMATFSKYDPHALLARMIGIVYHGFSLSNGGKWNWQAGPYKKIFAKPLSGIRVTNILLDLTALQIDLKQSPDPAPMAASRLAALHLKFAK